MSIYNSIEPAEDESHQAISSYFLGPKAENYEFFKKNVLEILEGQRDARLDYFPRDGVRVNQFCHRSRLTGIVDTRDL